MATGAGSDDQPPIVAKCSDTPQRRDGFHIGLQAAAYEKGDPSSERTVKADLREEGVLVGGAPLIDLLGDMAGMGCNHRLDTFVAE
jgi:hypothetical protein